MATLNESPCIVIGILCKNNGHYEVRLSTLLRYLYILILVCSHNCDGCSTMKSHLQPNKNKIRKRFGIDGYICGITVKLAWKYPQTPYSASPPASQNPMSIYGLNIIFIHLTTYSLALLIYLPLLSIPFCLIYIWFYRRNPFVETPRAAPFPYAFHPMDPFGPI